MSTPTKPPEVAQRLLRRRMVGAGAFRYSAIQLLAVLGLLFVTSPFIEDLHAGDMIESVLLTVVMIFAVLAVGGQRRTFVIAILLVTPAVVGKWINRVRPDVLSPAMFLTAAIVFFGFVVAHLLRFILRAPRVDANVICAGLSGYLMLGLTWMPAYVAVARLNPAAFTMSAPGAIMDGFNAFYFSFITLCTVGYGDVVPTSKMARMLAVVEALIGLFYMTVLISRLVAVYSSTTPSTEPAENQPSRGDKPDNDLQGSVRNE